LQVAVLLLKRLSSPGAADDLALAAPVATRWACSQGEVGALLPKRQ
jgi:hypothetical protein